MGVNSLQWYHLPALGSVGQSVSMEGDEWHHCFHVMRMQVGDQIMVCDGKGGCMQGVIRSAKAKEGLLELTHDHSVAFRNPRDYKVSLGMAPTKSIDRTEFAMEKLIEIGVEEIAFLDCDHNERTYLRLDRLQKISIAASKQSKKTVFPSLQDLVSAEDYVDRKSHLQ